MGTQPVAPGLPLPSPAPGPCRATASSKPSLLQAKCSIIPVLIWGRGGGGVVSLCSFFKTHRVSIPFLLGSGPVLRPRVGREPAPPWSTEGLRGEQHVKLGCLGPRAGDVMWGTKLKQFEEPCLRERVQN